MGAAKLFKYEDIPHEVWWVATIQYSGQPIGQKTYDQVQEIINKYPQYFAWEHKWKKIPKEVHEAFLDECYPDRHKAWEMPIKSDKGFAGYIPEILNSNPKPLEPLTKEDVINFFDSFNRIERERIDEENRIRKIWNKHYKKYKLEYRQ